MNTDQKTMTIQEVANRLVELCRKGQMLEAQEELFSDDVESSEPTNSRNPSVKGKEAVLAKGKQFVDLIEEHHGGSFSDPIIGGNFFSVACAIDVTLKGQGRMQIEEICVYEVKDGKIKLEQFFY